MADPAVVLDLSGLQSRHQPERGIPRTIVETTRALLRAGYPVARLALSPLRPPPPHLPADLRATGLVGWHDQPSFEVLRRQGPVVLHLFSPFDLDPPLDATLVPSVAAPGARLTAHFHDAIPARAPDVYLDRLLGRVRYESCVRVLRATDLVFAISAHAAAEATAVIGLPPSSVRMVGAGAGGTFTPDPPPDGDVLPDQLPARFVLAVGGGEPRKNLGRLVTAFGGIDDPSLADVALVQVGRVEPEVVEAWRRSLPEDRRHLLVTLGMVDDAVLAALYRAATAFVFPSLDEGFGLPVLEAAASGAVVVTSDRTSVPEILAEPSTTFDPTDIATIRGALVAALTDEDLRATSRAAGVRASHRWTWDATARRMAEGWRSLTFPPPAAVRERIAVVGPSPAATAEGPTARAVSAAVAALGSEGTVSWFPGRVPAEVPAGAERVMPAAALGRVAASTAYDRVVVLFDAPGALPDAVAAGAGPVTVVALTDDVAAAAADAAVGVASELVVPSVAAWADAEDRLRARPIRPSVRVGEPGRATEGSAVRG